MGLKENIKKYRLSNDMTLEDVAKYVGVSRQTIQKYESGVISNIPKDKIEKLAKLFNVSPSKLVGWDNVEKLLNELNKNVDILEKAYFSDENELKDFKKFQTTYMDYMNSLSHEEYIQHLANNKSIKEMELLNKFNQLNENGQEKAIESVDLLTKVPEYKK